MSEETNTLLFDYDTPMRHNLLGVFSQRDPALRRQVLEEFYTPDAILIDPEATAQGWDAISDTVAALLVRLPPDFVFHAEGPAVGHHGAGRLRWHFGPEGGPPAITGFDVAFFQDGRIHALYVFVDPPAEEPHPPTPSPS